MEGLPSTTTPDLQKESEPTKRHLPAFSLNADEIIDISDEMHYKSYSKNQ